MTRNWLHAFSIFLGFPLRNIFIDHSKKCESPSENLMVFEKYSIFTTGFPLPKLSKNIFKKGCPMKTLIA